MTFVSLGDLARTLASRNQSAALRNDMHRQTVELGSGQRSEAQDRGALASLVHRATVLETRAVVLRETGAFFSAAQSGVGRVAALSGDLGRQAITLGATAPGSTVHRTAEAARQALDDVVSALNVSQAGRAVFAGNATTEAPLMSGRDLLDRVIPIAAGATDLQDLVSRVEAWFADPSGFRAEAYRGSAESLSPFALGDGAEVDQHLRADDPAFAAVLRDVTLMALASRPDIPLSLEDRIGLQIRAGQSLIGSERALVASQEALGASQERIDRQQARIASERISLETARSDLLAADPFQTALALQETQNRLEAFYAATARSARLSLVAFLR